MDFDYINHVNKGTIIIIIYYNLSVSSAVTFSKM